MQAIIVVAMAFESVSSTARALASAAGVEYIPHTLLQYQELIDRSVNAVYLGCVCVFMS